MPSSALAHRPSEANTINPLLLLPLNVGHPPHDTPQNITPSLLPGLKVPNKHDLEALVGADASAAVPPDRLLDEQGRRPRPGGSKEKDGGLENVQGKVTALGLSTWRRRPIGTSTTRQRQLHHLDDCIDTDKVDWPEEGGDDEGQGVTRKPPSLGMGMTATPARKKKARFGSKGSIGLQSTPRAQSSLLTRRSHSTQPTPGPSRHPPNGQIQRPAGEEDDEEETSSSSLPLSSMQDPSETTFFAALDQSQLRRGLDHSAVQLPSLDLTPMGHALKRPIRGLGLMHDLIVEGTLRQEDTRDAETIRLARTSGDGGSTFRAGQEATESGLFPGLRDLVVPVNLGSSTAPTGETSSSPTGFHPPAPILDGAGPSRSPHLSHPELGGDGTHTRTHEDFTVSLNDSTANSSVPQEEDVDKTLSCRTKTTAASRLTTSTRFTRPKTPMVRKVHNNNNRQWVPQGGSSVHDRQTTPYRSQRRKASPVPAVHGDETTRTGEVFPLVSAEVDVTWGLDEDIDEEVACAAPIHDQSGAEGKRRDVTEETSAQPLQDSSVEHGRSTRSHLPLMDEDIGDDDAEPDNEIPTTPTPDGDDPHSESDRISLRRQSIELTHEIIDHATGMDMDVDLDLNMDLDLDFQGALDKVTELPGRFVPSSQLGQSPPFRFNRSRSTSSLELPSTPASPNAPATDSVPDSNADDLPIAAAISVLDQQVPRQRPTRQKSTRVTRAESVTPSGGGHSEIDDGPRRGIWRGAEILAKMEGEMGVRRTSGNGNERRPGTKRARKSVTFADEVDVEEQDVDEAHAQALQGVNGGASGSGSRSRVPTKVMRRGGIKLEGAKAEARRRRIEHYKDLKDNYELHVQIVRRRVGLR